MLMSHLSSLFACPAKPAASDRLLNAPPPPPCGTPRPAAQVAVNRTADGVVVRVKGEAGGGCAGALLDGLLGLALPRPEVVALDLSELRSVSSLAVGVLAAYCRSVSRAGGRVRLVGEVQPAVKDAMVRADLFGLFEPAALAGRAPDGPS
jgi:anti-anti-sigma factor